MVKNTQISPTFCIQINWKTTLCFLLLFCLLVKLGCWQLDRAEQKRQLQQTRTERLLADPMALDSLILEHHKHQSTALDQQQFEFKKDLQWLSVSLQGYYINDKSLLIRGQFYKGRPGYELITPFKLAHNQAVVLISRGWLEAGQETVSSERVLPSFQPIPGLLHVVGNIHVPVLSRYFLSKPLVNVVWPLELQHLDINVISGLFDEPLLPYVIRLKDNEAGILIRNWRKIPINSHTHVAYALQWFAMSSVVMLVLLATNTNIVSIVRAKLFLN